MDKLKITALMVVINEKDWVRWSLKSIYPAVDEIIIAEGAALDMWKLRKYFTPDGLSTDSTSEEIRKFIEEEDKDGKVKYLQVGFRPSMNSLRNETLRACDSSTSYCLVADADHLYDKRQIDFLRELCTKYPNIRVVYAEQLMFFWDMHHILIVNEDKREKLGYYLPCFFFRYKPDLRYFEEISFQDHCLGPGEWLHSAPRRRVEELSQTEDDVIVFPPLFQFWHFGWVKKRKELERHLMRVTWSHILKVENQDPESLSGLDKSYWLPLSKMSEEEILRFHHLYHKIWTGIFDERVGETLIPYNGPYPIEEELKKHPFRGKNRDFFQLEVEDENNSSHDNFE